MPSDEENAQYLYLVLTHAGTPTIDWDPICESLELNKGAVTKRWSRLKQSVEKGEAPGASAYQFLWLCLKHSTRDKAMDWAAIAEVCGTTKGAASKRYSRLKLAFERGDGPPASSVNDGTPKSTPKKTTPRKATTKTTPEATPKSAFKGNAPKTEGWTPINASSEDPEPLPPSVSKRKRAAPKKKLSDEPIKPEAGEDECIAEEKTQKRPRVSKKKTVVKDEVVDDVLTPRTDDQGATLSTPSPEEGPVIKKEGSEHEGGFVDAHEYLQNECARGSSADTTG